MNHVFWCFVILFSLPSISCELMIKVATSYEWPPYVVKSGGKVSGLEVDILDAVLSRTSFCSEYVEMPSSSRALEELKQKRVDLLLAASIHPDRELYATFSRTYRDEKMVVFAQKTFTPLIQIIDHDSYLDQLNYKKSIIAVNNGSVYGAKFADFLTHFEGSVVNTTLAKQRFDMLKKDRVDYAIEDELAGIFLLKDKRYSDYIENTKMVVNYDTIHYMIRPDLMSDEQLKRFNKAIEDSQPTIKKILKKYSTNS